jgi:hypothetical protein
MRDRGLTVADASDPDHADLGQPMDIVSPAVVTLVAKLGLQLAQGGVKRWVSNRAFKKNLGLLLMHVQDELDKNYKSLEDSCNGSQNERLETAVYGHAEETLFKALEKDKGLLDLIRGSYQITPGIQSRLRQPLTDERYRGDIRRLQIQMRLSSHEIDSWLEQKKLAPRVSKQDCKFQDIRELLAGWPQEEQLRISRRWDEFREALRAVPEKAHRYSLDDFIAVTMGGPAQEAKWIGDAAARWDWRYSFEVQEGIHELGLEPGIHLLFGGGKEWQYALAIVPLSGRPDDIWCSKSHIDLARCRQKTMLTR